jgi:RNA polymerase sigma factor (sigma-70 family)
MAILSNNNKVPHSDQKYIDALLSNDTVLLEELYKKFSGKIKQMVLQNNGTETDAADIFQDALLSVYDKAKTQNFVLTCPFEAFIYLICRNKWLNELSKRKTSKITIRDVEEYNNIGEDSFKLAEETRLHQVRKKILEEKLSELGETGKELLRLSWSGKSMEEVARILNVTYGYARKKKSECMKKLIVLVKQSSEYSSLKW